jgi:hypothetical protein
VHVFVHRGIRSNPLPLQTTRLARPVYACSPPAGAPARSRTRTALRFRVCEHTGVLVCASARQRTCMAAIVRVRMRPRGGPAGGTARAASPSVRTSRPSPTSERPARDRATGCVPCARNGRLCRRGFRVRPMCMCTSTGDAAAAVAAAAAGSVRGTGRDICQLSGE